MTTSTFGLSIAYALHKIEHAPNVRCAIAAYDAAVGGSDLSVHRKAGTEWGVWQGESQVFSGSFSQVRTYLAASAEEILDHEVAAEIASVPAPAMVMQQAQQQQACAAPDQMPWAGAWSQKPEADKWMRISSRIYGDSLIGAIEAERAEVVCAGDWYDHAALPVVRVEGGRFIVLGYAENEAAAVQCGRCWEYRFDVAVLVRGDDKAIAYVLLGDGTLDNVEDVQQQAPTAAPVQHPVGRPTHGWLDEEVHAYVAGVIEELMPDEDAAPRPIVTARETAELDAYVATKAWVYNFERDCAVPGSVPFGELFDARQAMQVAHARLDALTAKASN